LPSQKAALVSVPAMQEGEPHMVDGGAFAQVWLAAQAPVLPQMPFGVHRLCGSGLPVPTKEQVPLLPATLQAWQRGQLLSAVLQQTPSTHRPAAHGWSAEHASPRLPPLMHLPVPVSQKLPAAQSLLLVQVVLQPAVVQA
jgi:hypothetical protein